MWPQNDTGPVSSSRGVRAFVAGLVVVSLAACSLPLTDHLGYELSEVVALYFGLFGAAIGVAAVRRRRPLREALRVSLVALAIPVAAILLNALRRPACDPLGGLVLYAVIALPSLLLAVALGAACASVAPRRAGVLVGAIFVASLAVALWPMVRGPQVFVFHHLGGLYPGPIYDEDIRATPALWWFRLCTMLYAVGCFGIARRNAFAIALLAAVGLSSQAVRFHWQASAANLAAELGGEARSADLVLHFPREKSAGERALLLEDAEAQARAARAFLGAGKAPVEVWLYRSPEEKRRLIGAAETSFTKPWLRQIHTNDEPAPHHLLRHELAHALAADFAPGPWRVAGGLVPQMAFVEGLAVAADWPAGEFTVHEETRALRELGRLPDLERLFRTGRFYAEAGPVAYTAAGSFIRFLWETRGAQFVRDAYAGKAPLGDLPALVAEHRRFLDSLPPNPRAVALARQRFATPAIVRRHCPHEVASLRREAASAPAARAAGLWAKCAALEPDDPALLLALRRAQVAAGETEAAQATLAKLLAHPKLSAPLRAQALTDAGDAAWKADDAARAAQLYAEAAQLSQPEPLERALLARQAALVDRAQWPALRRLLVDGEAGPEVVLALRDLDLAHPHDGLFAYLLAKQLQNRGSWAACAAYARRAAGLRLPDPLFLAEARRMLGIAAWHLGDSATARAAFEELGRNATAGRALEAARWLERL